MMPGQDRNQGARRLLVSALDILANIRRAVRPLAVGQVGDTAPVGGWLPDYDGTGQRLKAPVDFAR